MPNVSTAKPAMQKSPPGYSYRATYSIPLLNVTPTTATYVVAAINAGPLLNTRIRRIFVWNSGSFTAAQKTSFDLIRLTAASSGGVPYVPNSYDPIVTRDNAYSGIILTTAPTVTTGGTSIFTFSAYSPGATTAFTPFAIDWQSEITKAPIIPAGVTNGLALRVTNGGAGAAGLDITFELTEEEY